MLPQPPSIRQSKGSVLLFSLWFTAGLLGIIFFLLTLSRETIKTTKDLLDKLEAQLQAESTIELLKFYGATGKFTPQRIENAHLQDLGIPSSFPLTGKAVQLEKAKFLKEVKVCLQDTGGKINVWALSPFVLRRLLIIKGIDDSSVNALIDSLMDWYDKDDLHRLNGAETHYYEVEKGFRYGPRNYPAPQSIYELSLIKGFNNPEIWEKISPYLSLYPRGMMNINTMDEYLLMAALDVPEEIAKQLLRLREEKGFLTLNDVSAIAGKRMEKLAEVIGIFPTMVVEVKVEAYCNGAREHIYCSIDFRPDERSPYRILEFSY